MSKREWKLFIEDIMECIGRIEKYIEGMEFEDFEIDDKTIDAVVRNLEVVGEAARNIPEDVKARYPDVYWKGVVGLRNRIIHEYFGVDSKIIWHIVKEELLTLLKQMKRILEKDEG